MLGRGGGASSAPGTLSEDNQATVAAFNPEDKASNLMRTAKALRRLISLL